MNSVIRSFIAIDIPQVVTEKFYRLSLSIKSEIKDLRPTLPQNIHLTLKFLGNVEALLIEQIKNVLDNTAGNSKKIEMQFGKIGAFPNLKSPRVLWIAPQRGAEAIKELKEKLDNKLFALGIKKDDKIFKTHITIARLKKRKAGLDFKHLLNSKVAIKDEITIGTIHLYKSSLTPKGPIYTKLHSSPFKN